MAAGGSGAPEITPGTAGAMLISQLAARAGVPSSTLRFYEHQGLLPAGRTPGGYRVYGQDALDRLAFIATAKRLGLELPEIRELLGPWQHGTCRQVQARLGDLLAARLADADRHAGRLATFRAELRAAQRHLARIDRDGPCERSCSFLHPTTVASSSAPTGPPAPPAPAAPTISSVPASAPPAPIACSLSSTDYRDRAQRWAAVLAAASGRRAHSGGIVVEFASGHVDVAELAVLAGAEAACCPFLTLTVGFAPTPMLTVQAPPEAAAVVADLFGRPDRPDPDGTPGGTPDEVPGGAPA